MASYTSNPSKSGLRNKTKSIELDRLTKARQNRWVYLGLIYLLFF